MVNMLCLYFLISCAADRDPLRIHSLVLGDSLRPLR